MKKRFPYKRYFSKELSKALLIMKLTILFIFLGVLKTNADIKAQPGITLNIKNDRIENVIRKIEKQGEYRFLYNTDLAALRSKVDLNIKEFTISQTMDVLLRNTGLKYKLLPNNLVVIQSTQLHDQQDITVTGTVSGAGGIPLTGATVHVKNSQYGVTTNDKGAFSITVPEDAVLVVSYVGYETVEINVNNRTSINVTLQPSTTALTDVVVVGYGTQKKADLTGAVSVVTSKDIENRPIIDAGEALQGKAAGVQVTSNSGKPGAGLSIRIRGSSSISAGNDPLYIVDGIPTTDISEYNPADIASISILKDAASAAIYGTRAANGVVVITTKKGVPGKSKISAGAYYGITSPTKMLKVLNAKQYQDYANELRGPGTISDSLIQANNINWPKEVIGQGNQQNYQLAVSGGSEKTTHYISFNYLDQTGMIKPAKFDRFTGRVNLTTKVNNWLSLNTSTLASHSRTNGVDDNLSVARGGVVLSAMETPPTVPKFNPDGTIGFNPFGNNWENPYGAILGRYNKTYDDHLFSNIGADVKLVKGLVFTSHFGLDYLDQKYNFFLDPFLTIYGRQTQGQNNQTKTNNLTWLSEQTINYKKDFGKSHLTALAGWTAQKSHTEQTYLSGSFLKPEYRLLSWDATYMRDSIKQPGTTGIDEWALMSYLGRITYDYDGKYLFQANIRSDHSSKFAPGNRDATFPSFSAGWRISSESFMRNISAINDLKLRVGWGKNGNQEGIGSYDYLSKSNVDPVTGAVSIANIAPASLTWETTTQTNIGIDAAFLDSRITFTGDFYIKKTKNILVNYPVASQPVSSVAVNGASMQNIGEEFLITSKNISTKSFNWNTSFNISFNQNKVLDIGMGIPSMPSFGSIYERGSAINLIQGYGLGEFYGYVAEGVDPATGLELYLSKDGKKTSSPVPSDRRLLGSALPTFVYGMTNDLSYKNFDLTFFIQGSQGNKIFNAGRLEMEAMRTAINQSADIVNRWRKPGDITDIPAVSVNQSTDNTRISSRFLENGSYLRFKTITLSYNVNPKVLSGLGLSSASVFVSGNNLLTITKYKGFDPEVNSYGGSNNSSDNRNVSLGIDNGAYPQPKMILFGINVSLK
ncbi:MAG TPA: TonB-dependent receptor [Hanamia sp.]|nr:TonB-dependent receptor [Hanamia sp.]